MYVYVDMYVTFYYLQYSQDAKVSQFLPFLSLSESPPPNPETVCEPKDKGLEWLSYFIPKNVCTVDLTPNYTVILYLFMILKNVKNI